MKEFSRSLFPFGRNAIKPHPLFTAFRILLCVLGVLLAMPLLGFVAFAVGAPITASGLAYLAGALLLAAGLILAPWKRRLFPALALGGPLLVVLVAGTRLVLAGRAEASGLKMIVLPQGTGTRWVDTLVDEQDTLIFGEKILYSLGGVSSNEDQGISAALAAAYAGMRRAHPVFPSPVLSTYLGLEGPSSSDAVVIEPEAGGPPRVGVVFLHGWMGNVTLQCWQIARAAQAVGAVTVCPSTVWTGDWNQPSGKTIVQDDLDYLRRRGIQKLYLGGYSNGGFGVSQLAPGLVTDHELQGLFFISGISNGAALGALGLPILILQDSRDERVPAAVSRQAAAAIGPQATYVEIEGDHFLIMKRPDPVQAAIRAWLENH